MQDRAILRSRPARPASWTKLSRAILVNPESPEEIAEKMLLLEKDDQYYRKQEEYGIIRAKLFSWRLTAESLLNVYEKIYRQKKH